MKDHRCPINDLNEVTHNNNLSSSLKLSIADTLDKMQPQYRDPYKDKSEIQLYCEDGSYYYRKNNFEVLRIITKEAIRLGLESNLVFEFMKGADIWQELDKNQRKDLITAFVIDRYFPSVFNVVEALEGRFHFKCVPQLDTDREMIYGFNGQVYERFEEIIKHEADVEFTVQRKNMLDRVEGIEEDKALRNRLMEALNRGPSRNEIDEVLASIRRRNFTNLEMNPPGYIPFRNGLLNLETRVLEPFSPEKFYTFQVNAKYLGTHITLMDTPKFCSHLRSTYYETDIPMILSYQAYCLYPGFPAHKTLSIAGPPRVGKGVTARLTQGLLSNGAGSFSLSGLLTAERFYYQNIQGKNLLVDGDANRTFRRGVQLAWSRFTKLFGGDTLDLEEKGKTSKDYISKSKMITLFNLPMMKIYDPPAITRFLLVQTRAEKPKVVIPDLEKEILNDERDKIATLLMQVLFKLIDRNFLFPGQLTDEATGELLDKLADPVDNFIEEAVEDEEGAQVRVEDAFNGFKEWCSTSGVTLLKRQVFVKKFGDVYTKKRLGPKGKQEYFFMDCTLSEEEKRTGLSSWIPNEPPESPHIKPSGMRYRGIQHEHQLYRFWEKDK